MRAFLALLAIGCAGVPQKKPNDEDLVSKVLDKCLVLEYNYEQCRKAAKEYEDARNNP